jgi:Spy/CpxP family protein refolding chaperone
VLALAKQLSLTDEPSRQVRLVFDRMSAAARPLGDEVIAHERTLDQLLAADRADRDSATAETASIGELQGRLRSVHLAAHLEMRALLTSDKVKKLSTVAGIRRQCGAVARSSSRLEVSNGGLHEPDNKHTRHGPSG